MSERVPGGTVIVAETSAKSSLFHSVGILREDAELSTAAEAVRKYFDSNSS